MSAPFVHLSDKSLRAAWDWAFANEGSSTLAGAYMSACGGVMDGETANAIAKELGGSAAAYRKAYHAHKVAIESRDTIGRMVLQAIKAAKS